jgi:FemAB-related protein (PEP-CTERM system-associated)
MVSQIQVRSISDRTLWDDFVYSNNGTFFHSFLWGDILEKTFKYERVYIGAFDNDKLVSVLPSFLIKSRLFGNKLSSLPMTDLAGPVGKKGIKELLDYCINLARNRKLDFIQLKTLQEIDSNFQKLENYSTFVLNIEKSPEEIWKGFDKGAVRNPIKQAEKYGLELTFATEEEEVKNFYSLYLKTMKRLGTPPYPLSFYLNMWKELKPLDKIQIMFAKYQNKMIASLILILDQPTAYYLSAVSEENYLFLHPNHFLLFHAIESLIQKKFKTFDFGRSRTKGVYDFKKRWGGTPAEYSYYYYFNKQKKFSLGSYRKYSEIWKSLPMPIVKILGPSLRRELGY